MEVHCGSCPAKYAIPDDKVRGKKVRIKCKHCSAAIIVDGTSLGGSPSAAPKAASAPPQVAQPKPAEPRPEPAAAAKPAVAQPKPAAAEPQPAAAPAPAPVPMTASKPATVRLSGSAATATGAARASAASAARAPERSPDSGAWREPAQERSPTSRPNPHAGWREPAAATPRGINRTMLGIPAPATMPARTPKATLMGGLDGPLPGAAPAALPTPSPLIEPAPTRPPRSVKRTMLGIPAPAGELPLKPEAPRPAPEPPRIPTPPPPAPEPTRGVAELEQSSEPEWTVAISDDDHQELTTSQVLEAYASGRIADDTFIWAEGMDDWKNPFDIPLIAAQLEARGFALGGGSLGNEDRTVVADGPSESKPSGVWREPGNWNEPPIAEDGEQSDVSFDDVTVSMDSSKAAELLRAAGAMDESVQTSATEQLLDDAGHDDVTLAVDSRPFFAESRPLSDLIEGARRHEAQAPSYDDGPQWDDEPTMAMEAAPGSTGMTGARNEDSVLFSLDALAQSEAGSKRDDKAEDDILLAPRPQAEGAPTTARFPPAFAPSAPEQLPEPPAPLAPPMPAAGPPHAAQPMPMPMQMPAPMMPPAEARPAVYAAVPGPMAAGPMPSTPAKRASRAWLWLLLFLLLAGAAAAAAFYFKQPAKIFEMFGLLPKGP